MPLQQAEGENVFRSPCLKKERLIERFDQLSEDDWKFYTPGHPENLCTFENGFKHSEVRRHKEFFCELYPEHEACEDEDEEEDKDEKAPGIAKMEEKQSSTSVVPLALSSMSTLSCCCVMGLLGFFVMKNNNN